ncbi:TFIIB-type zinc ribbon-containing protein [Paenibacillus senegalensis]|uniref:TFIIB-type zinc ribbon-containing protein n=1 Tax=Paenibacillus senegalensis TaxID=1465766 RepID=UPI000289F4B0|nr:zf-TFIIB domain-containing protein [Paenibacillus senegalensis]
MKCPICNDVRMREVKKDDVAIDVCPDCKGVWLDRGELEKLMSQVKEERQEYDEWYDDRNRRSERQHYDRYDDDHRKYDQPYRDSASRPPYYKHKKKKSVLDRLGDLFD